MRRALLLALPALAAACATASRPAPTGAAAAAAAGAPEITFPPAVVRPTPLDLELAGKNDEELFAIGTAAFSAGDYRRAAGAFARLADLFPSSPHEAAALFDAGLAYEKLEEWRLALERFRTLERKYVGPDATEATFKAAECLWHLRELPEAHAILDRLAARADLSPTDAIRALTQRGIVELEAGSPEQAEKTLRLAVSRWQSASETERLDDYYPAQAQFYLGEVYRAWFLAIRLDPAADGEEKLAKDLEYKAEMLLSAQGHYLRAIKIGNADWTVAAGYRIGELYDDMYQALVDAPLPPGLDAEEAAAYRESVRKDPRARVVIGKAIATYEATLAAAERARVTDNAFVAKTQASLDRMKRALHEDEGGTDATPLVPAAPPAPAHAGPAERPGRT